jgi:hypothetical protein
VYLAYQTSHLSSSQRFPNTHNNPSTQLSSTQPVPPKRMDLHPSLPHSPSGGPSPLFSRPPAQMVQNLNVRTLRNQLQETLGIGQRISDMQASSHGWFTPGTNTSNYPWLILQQFKSLPQAKTQMRMDH